MIKNFPSINGKVKFKLKTVLQNLPNPSAADGLGLSPCARADSPRGKHLAG